MPPAARESRRSPSRPGAWTRAQRLTLIACILGSSAAFLDATIVNVALPAIRASLHGGLTLQEWVVDAYLLTLGSLLLVGGSLGDVLGRRRIFMAGMAGFGAASAACAIAPDPALLVGARAVQGIAAALLVPSNLALIMDTFPEQRRSAAIGTWTAWTGIATVAGPLLGGLLVQVASWRWVFAINLPLVLVTLWLARAIPSTGRDPNARVDWIGGLLVALGLAGPIFALIEQPLYGWGSPRVAGALLAGVGLLVAFGWWERRRRAPMLPFSIFRVRAFAVGNLSTFLLYGGLSLAMFFLVVFLQQVGGYRPLLAGLSSLPASVLLFLLARRFGALADRLGPRLFMGVGPIVAGAGLLLLLGVGAHPAYTTEVLPAVGLFGLGMSITVAPLTATVLSAAPAAHAGIASGVNNAIARVSGLIAIAAGGAVVAARFSSVVRRGLVARGAPAVGGRAIRGAASGTLQIHVPTGFPVAARAHVQAVLEHASVSAFHLAMLLAGTLAIAAGAVSLLGIATARR
ncbi:MAG TPA: MFS transporter [Solirubrobacteraceae bacterium]|nr:MFS transporter [Solirubrobacteraceae bacterium]